MLMADRIQLIDDLTAVRSYQLGLEARLNRLTPGTLAYVELAAKVEQARAKVAELAFRLA